MNVQIHHDALAFPSGKVVLLTRLCVGQYAAVLQLPADTQSLGGTHEAESQAGQLVFVD
jgi:hypothetical protein